MYTKTTRHSIHIFMLMAVLATGFILPGQGGQLFALEEVLSFSLDDANGTGDFSMTMERAGARPAKTRIASHKGLKLVKGFRGEPELRLADAEYQQDKDTEFLFHFDDGNDTAQGENGRYLVRGGTPPGITSLARFGKGAGHFNGSRDGLHLDAGKGSLFEPDTFWGDFTMEFWLYTGLTGEAEEIFKWDGYTRQSGKDLTQYFVVYLSDRKLNWEFKNFFISLDPDKGGMESRVIRLRSSRSLLNHAWQHHMLRYDSRRGMLEYLIDGKTEAITYASPSGRQENQVWQAYTGERSSTGIQIGRRFTGILDEFRFSRAWVDKPQLESHFDHSGWFMLNPVNFRDIGVGSKILSIETTSQTPGTSGLAWYYKMSDSPGLAMPDDPAWIPFKPGKEINSNNQGQFLFIKAEFFPDGSDMVSPSFQGLKVRYKPDPPPPPPGGLVAIAGNGSVTLRWNPVPGTDIRGYLVYYGTKPGEFFGEDAILDSIRKPSPMDVGNVHELRIDGLENGRIYYFRITTYDLSTDPLYGMDIQRSFSKEVSARPAR